MSYLKPLANTVCNFSQFETRLEIKIVQRKLWENIFTFKI